MSPADSRQRPGVIALLKAAGGPPRARQETLILLTTALLAGFASSAAFFLHMFGVIRMPFFVNFFFMPLIVLMLIVGIYSWQRRLPFWRRLRAGILAGALGLIAYDLTRLIIYKSGIFNYHPFHAIPKLGALVTGLTPAAPSSVYAGWTYHIWNGFSYAIIYALVAGPAKWGWGVAWAMILETLMVISYPTFLQIKLDAPFLAISFFGHLCYGTVLGVTVRRAAAEPPRRLVAA
jgi:hypothetical protein